LGRELEFKMVELVLVFMLRMQ